MEVRRHKEIARADAVEPKEWSTKGDALAGFVRIDPGDKERFVHDSGERYYPLGHNQAWASTGLPDIPAQFASMKEVGENWSRVWMNAWDGKNLDWASDPKQSVKPGEIDLNAARKWDAIMDAAEKNGIYFQLTLHHHGMVASKSGQRFSSSVDPNWESSPWNAANGGFLKDPADFFTDPMARKYTKRKLYYTMARYGYSPNILAWELFNEVENTDAAHGKLWQDISMWHREMAFFIREFDGYHHLVTSSASPGIALDSPFWEPLDYAQVHLYPSDVKSAVANATNVEVLKKLGKPLFVGEFGPAGLGDKSGQALHDGLWASIMSSPSGAAQYWSWDEVSKNDLWKLFGAASRFISETGLANKGGLVNDIGTVTTTSKAALTISPGGGFVAAKENEFIVGDSAPARLRAVPGLPLRRNQAGHDAEAAHLRGHLPRRRHVHHESRYSGQAGVRS